MALTVQRTSSRIAGMHVLRISFDNNYQTGGMPLSPSDLGFVPSALDEVFIADRKGYTFDYDTANQKVLVYQVGGAGSPDSEVAGGTDLSGLTGALAFAFGGQS